MLVFVEALNKITNEGRGVPAQEKVKRTKANQNSTTNKK
jgi:hypothetical protein